jgi:hypothetical protein
MKKLNEQEFADDFDCELYRFVRLALSRSDPHWSKIARRLEATRSLVRIRMSEKDRKATS